MSKIINSLLFILCSSGAVSLELMVQVSQNNFFFFRNEMFKPLITHNDHEIINIDPIKKWSIFKNYHNELKAGQISLDMNIFINNDEAPYNQILGFQNNGEDLIYGVVSVEDCIVNKNLSVAFRNVEFNGKTSTFEAYLNIFCDLKEEVQDEDSEDENKINLKNPILKTGKSHTYEFENLNPQINTLNDGHLVENELEIDGNLPEMLNLKNANFYKRTLGNSLNEIEEDLEEDFEHDGHNLESSNLIL
jgi:hypothetical protein